MRKENWINPKIEIRKAESEGKGMFATQLIEAGEEVVKFGGEYSNHREDVEAARTAGKLIMQWDDDLWSIEYRGDGEDYFLNHSCDSNLWMKDAYTLIAKRDVQIGEELTADYALWEADEAFVSKWECRCGSAKCRKQVTGKDWKNSELQERYWGHFTPLLNKRIASLRDMLSKQFSDPRLVASYDALNALGEDSEFFCQLACKLSAKTIIDLGCGTGLLTCELAKRGHEMIGIEPAGGMLDIARNKAYADKVQWIEGGYEKFAGLTADMILMTSHVAQFFLDDSEWQAMLQAAYSALKPGGHIVFDSRTPIFPPYQTWPTQDSPRRVEDLTVGAIDWWYKLLEIKDNRVRYQLYYHFINSDETVISTDELIFRSRDELTKSLERVGFKVETVYGDWDSSLATSTSPEMIFVAAHG